MGRPGWVRSSGMPRRGLSPACWRRYTLETGGGRGFPAWAGTFASLPRSRNPSGPLMDFKAGEFAGCTNRGRTPGFASVTHLGFDTPRIRVRLPEPEVIDAARSGLAPAPVDERSVLLARVVKAMGAQGDAYDIDEVHQWMRRATVEELREWLASGVEGGAK